MRKVPIRAGCPDFKPEEMKALATGNGGETIVYESGNTLKAVKSLC